MKDGETDEKKEESGEGDEKKEEQKVEEKPIAEAKVAKPEKPAPKQKPQALTQAASSP